MSNDPAGPHGGLSKGEQVELIWEEIDALASQRDQLLNQVDDIEFDIKELKAELHDIVMGVL